MPESLTIVIATYNERLTLPDLVPAIWSRIPTAHILVVDDNSPDGTGEWVRELSEQDNRIRLLHRETREGLGTATLAGLTLAMESQPCWIGTMDADLSHRPEDLTELWQSATAAAECDVVIGSRYVKGGRIENWSLTRRLASRLVNLFSRWVLRLKTRDNSGAFRLYRTQVLQRIHLSNIDCSGFAYLEQILMHLQRSGAVFCEVPILFTERRQGRSKATIGHVMSGFRDIMKLAIRRG